MKFYLKFLAVILLVFAVVIPMFLKGSDGKPLMSLRDWLPGSDRLIGWAREMGSSIERVVGDEDRQESRPGADAGAGQAQSGADVQNAPTSLAPETGKMYKWQDEQGRWHFSSEKPGDHRSVSIENLPEIKNVMETPVEADSDDSMIKLPGLGGSEKLLGGDILDGIQQMTEERDQ